MYGAEEGALSIALTTDAGTVADETLDLLGRREVPAGQHERLHTESPDRLDLCRAVADALVLGEDDPAATPAELEPLGIGNRLLVVAVDLGERSDVPPRGPQAGGNRQPSKTPIDEELTQRPEARRAGSPPDAPPARRSRPRRR